MAHYYKVKKLVAEATERWCKHLEAQRTAGEEWKPLATFKREQILEHGVSERMINKLIELIIPGAEMKGNRMVNSKTGEALDL